MDPHLAPALLVHDASGAEHVREYVPQAPRSRGGRGGDHHVAGHGRGDAGSRRGHHRLVVDLPGAATPPAGGGGVDNGPASCDGLGDGGGIPHVAPPDGEHSSPMGRRPGRARRRTECVPVSGKAPFAAARQGPHRHPPSQAGRNAERARSPARAEDGDRTGVSGRSIRCRRRRGRPWERGRGGCGGTTASEKVPPAGPRRRDAPTIASGEGRGQLRCLPRGEVPCDEGCDGTQEGAVVPWADHGRSSLGGGRVRYCVQSLMCLRLLTSSYFPYLYPYNMVFSTLCGR